jgi:hypothetical protein
MVENNKRSVLLTKLLGEETTLGDLNLEGGAIEWQILKK